jgi:NADH pyrophosphatase NudC (nudix superfamily)
VTVSAGPDDLIFSSAAADTHRLSVSCGGKEASAEGEVILSGPVTGPCLVKLVKKDRSRLLAEIEKPTAGRYTCFAADAKSCAR